MLVLALAGGNPGPSDEEALGCCFVFLLLPLVVCLAGTAAYHKDFWPAAAALVLAGVPYLVLRVTVAGYEPSDDWEVTDNQDAGRRIAAWYLWLVGVAAAALLYVGWRRLTARARPAGAGGARP